MARQLENWLNAYAEYVEFTEAPMEFHFWTGVGVISGAVRNHVWFDQLYWKWTPNFYIILVAPSGIATKSTAMNTGMQILREVPNIHFGPDKLTTEALELCLSEAAESMPTNWDDPLGLQSPTKQVSCLTFAISELGTYLRPKDDTFLSLLTDLWDGKDVLHTKTKTRGEQVIVRPWINLVACTTPSWLAENTSRLFILGGFASRCIFVYKDRKRKLVAYPSLEATRDLSQLRAALVRDLKEISRVHGQFQLTKQALAFGQSWYESLSNNPPEQLSAAEFGGYLARKQGHAHKIAMILSLSERSDLVITEQNLRDAVDLLEASEKEMHKVFSEINSSPDKEKVERILEVLRRHRTLPRSTLFNFLFQRYHLRLIDFNAIVEALQASNLIRVVQRGTTIYVEIIEKETPPLPPPHPPPDQTPEAAPVDDTKEAVVETVEAQDSASADPSSGE